MFKKLVTIFTICCLLGSQALANTGGSSADMSREKMYSIFLYQFARYVDWPTHEVAEEFVIGVYGVSGVTDMLENIATTKKIKDAKIKVVEISSAADIANCHILFVPGKRNGVTEEIAAQAKAAHVLLVAESPKGIDKGAVIHFIEINQRLNFELNLDLATAYGLQVSPALKSLAANLN